MTDNTELVSQLREMDTTLANLDIILRRFGPSMVETEVAAIETCANLIEALRAEALVASGLMTADDFAGPPEEIDDGPDAQDETTVAIPDETEAPAPDPKLEKARAALKPKQQKR